MPFSCDALSGERRPSTATETDVSAYDASHQIMLNGGGDMSPAHHLRSMCLLSDMFLKLGSSARIAHLLDILVGDSFLLSLLTA